MSYLELKENYREVLENDDEFFADYQKEKRRLKKHIICYSLIWIFALFLLFIAFEFITDYPIIKLFMKETSSIDTIYEYIKTGALI